MRGKARRQVRTFTAARLLCLATSPASSISSKDPLPESQLDAPNGNLTEHTDANG